MSSLLSVMPQVAKILPYIDMELHIAGSVANYGTSNTIALEIP